MRNQRVERFNLDVNVTRTFSAIFRDFECNLDSVNDTDVFCLQYIYVSRINQVLREFIMTIFTSGPEREIQQFHWFLSGLELAVPETK